MKRRNPRNGADTTASSRKHLTFESSLLNWKGRKGPDHFERQGTQGVKQFFMRDSKLAPSDTFLPLLSHRREPTWCPSLPAHPSGDKELGWCRAAATLFKLLSFVLLFNKPKKQGKKKKKRCKELHNLRKQTRRYRRGLWFVSHLAKV